jgi:hypothetical protein
MLQLVVSNYHPDLIVSYDGYNDINSLKLNYQVNNPSLPVSPKGYHDFKVVSKNRQEQNLFHYIGQAMFKNIVRLIFSVHRKYIQNENYSNMDKQTVDQHIIAYAKVVRDYQTYCKGLGTDYIHFMEPVNFNETNSFLWGVYGSLNDKMNNIPYSKSLSFFSKKELFDDECHANEEGLKNICNEIVKHIVPVINKNGNKSL